MEKSKASAATVFSPPDKLSIGRNLIKDTKSLVMHRSDISVFPQVLTMHSIGKVHTTLSIAI